MALAETYLGAALAAIVTALLGIFSWAWQLSQRVAVLEANAASAAATAARTEESVLRVDRKLDEIIKHLLNGGSRGAQ